MNKLIILLGVIILVSGCSVLDINDKEKEPFTFLSKELSFSGFTFLQTEENSINIYGFQEINGLVIRIFIEEPYRGEGKYDVSFVRVSDGIGPLDGPNIIAIGIDSTNLIFTIDKTEDEILKASFKGEFAYSNTFGQVDGKSFFVKANFELKEGEYFGEIR